MGEGHSYVRPARVEQHQILSAIAASSVGHGGGTDIHGTLTKTGTWPAKAQ